MACGVPWRSRRSSHSRSSWQGLPPRGASGSAGQTSCCPVSPARRCPGSSSSAQGCLLRVAWKPGGAVRPDGPAPGQRGAGTGQPPHGIRQAGDGSCFLWVSSLPGLKQQPSLLPRRWLSLPFRSSWSSLHTHDTYQGLLQDVGTGLRDHEDQGPFRAPVHESHHGNLDSPGRDQPSRVFCTSLKTHTHAQLTYPHMHVRAHTTHVPTGHTCVCPYTYVSAHIYACTTRPY